MAKNAQEAAEKGKAGVSNDHVLKLACHPYLLAVVFYVFAMLLVYLLSQHQYNKNLKAVTDANIESVVSFVAKTIEALNIATWASEDAKEFVIPPIGEKDQIQSIVITNALGGIVYPQDRAYDILEDETLESVLQKSSVAKYQYNSAEVGTFFYPVFSGKTLRGAIVLQYNRMPLNPNTLSAVFSNSALALFIVGIGAAMLLVWLILMPWRTLHSKFEHSIRSAQDVEFGCTQYTEVNNMIKLFRLLLLRQKK